MSKHDPIADVPKPDAVRATLQRIVTSDVFRSSPQLASFLSFVVESVLHGKSDRIKGYTIAVEVLRRDIKFDPQLDPIVRVEATRLRRALERYYSGPGLEEPIVIDMPRGTYVPTFRLRKDIAEDEPDAARAPRFGIPQPSWPVRALVIVLIVLAGAAWLIELRFRGTPSAIVTSPAATTPDGTERLSPGNGLPVLFIQPFTVTGTPGAQSISATSLYARLASAFSQFDLVNIRWQLSDGVAGPPTNGKSTETPSHIDYRLIGTIEYDDRGAARLRFLLLDTATNMVIWTRVIEHVTGDDAAAETFIVRQLSETLVQPFGVIYSDGRNKSERLHQGDPRYRCVLETIESFRSFDVTHHTHARLCLERLTSADPNFAIGFSYLAALDLREYLYRLDVHQSELPPLERALRAAQRGVELNPESSRAYEILFVVLFARRDLAAAFAAGDKAIALNKFDMRSVGSYGARLIAKGDVDHGMAVLAQAEAGGRIVPAFEQFFLFLGDYLRGDKAGAALHADQLTGDTFQLGLIARALVASGKGDRAAAHKELDRLVTLNPAWRDDLRGSLGRFFVADFIADRLARDLTAAGLTGTN